MLLLEVLQDNDADLIRASAAAVLADPLAVTATFYARVFALRPGLRVLFPSDMQAQQAKLAHTLGAVLGALDDLDDLEDTLLRMGAAHRGYGAKPAHYALINQALIDTLAEFGGGAFGAEERQAWARLLTFIAQTMLRGARD